MNQNVIMRNKMRALWKMWRGFSWNFHGLYYEMALKKIQNGPQFIFFWPSCICPHKNSFRPSKKLLYALMKSLQMALKINANCPQNPCVIPSKSLHYAWPGVGQMLEWPGVCQILEWPGVSQKSEWPRDESRSGPWCDCKISKWGVRCGFKVTAKWIVFSFVSCACPFWVWLLLLG